MTPEFSRIFNLDRVGQLAYTYEIKATPEELAAIAPRYDLLSISKLEAKFEIRKGASTGDYEVEAQVIADVVQACIVNLTAVPDHLEFGYKLNLVEGDEDRYHDDIDWHAEAEKEYDLEFYQDSALDLGEITIQYLGLELNPYPRADVTTDEYDLPKNHGQTNPFTILDILKSRTPKS